MKKKMRVLAIVGTRFGYDGITNVVTNYYTYQNHENLRMDLLTINPIDDTLKCQLKQNGDVNYVLPYRNSNPVKYFFRLIQIMKKGKYEIVHAHGGSCTLAVEMLAAKVAGVKVRIPHSHSTYSDFGRVNKLLRPVFEFSYTDGFACGQEAGEWLYTKRPFTVINNGVDLEKYAYNQKLRDEFRSRYQLGNQLVIGHVGRFNVQKNHDKLIDIYEAISRQRDDVILILIGDGELKESIEKKVREKKLNVLFVGLSDEIPGWLQAMDIMLFPSLYEGLPLTIVEAQAAGLRCVLSNTISPMTAITELVKFVPLESDNETWANELLNTPLQQREQNRKVIQSEIQKKHYDIRENCKDVLKKYGELLCR